MFDRGLDHTWQCLGPTPCSMLGDHSWQHSQNHARVPGIKPGSALYAFFKIKHTFSSFGFNFDYVVYIVSTTTNHLVFFKKVSKYSGCRFMRNWNSTVLNDGAHIELS